MKNRPGFWIVWCAALVAANAMAAQPATDYPNRPIRLVVPFAPGGAADILGRILSERLAPLYGQPVVVDNKPGASGHVGAQLVAQAPPDGYTLMVGTIGIHAAYASYRKLGYDPARDLLSMVGAERWRSLFPDSYRRYLDLNPAPDFHAFVAAVRAMWLDEGAGGYPGDAVDRIACSLLLVRGEDDHLLSRESLARLAGRVPRARTVHVAHAGHAVHEDQPEAVMRAVNPFATVVWISTSQNANATRRPFVPQRRDFYACSSLRPSR